MDEPERDSAQKSHGSHQDSGPADNSPTSGPEHRPHPFDPRRWADGTWRNEHDASLQHGVRRYELRGVLPADARAHVDAFHTGLLADRGGEGEVAVIEAGYVRRLAQLEGALELLGADIADRGVMTQRGRPRAAYTLFLRTLETWDRLAQRLGLERRAKRIDLAQAFAQQERDR